MEDAMYRAIHALTHIQQHLPEGYYMFLTSRNMGGGAVTIDDPSGDSLVKNYGIKSPEDWPVALAEVRAVLAERGIQIDEAAAPAVTASMEVDPMMLRFEAARSAMQGLLASGGYHNEQRVVADESVLHADTLLAALARTAKPAADSPETINHATDEGGAL